MQIDGADVFAGSIRGDLDRSEYGGMARDGGKKFRWARELEAAAARKIELYEL